MTIRLDIDGAYGDASFVTRLAAISRDVTPDSYGEGGPDDDEHDRHRGVTVGGLHGLAGHDISPSRVRVNVMTLV